MSRWLKAANQVSGVRTKGTIGTKGSAKNPDAPLLSVLSLLSQPPNAEIEASVDVGPERAATLPTEPPTCAVCGVADWRVALTEPDGRRLHVACSGLLDPDGVARAPEAIHAVWDEAEALALAPKSPWQWKSGT